MGKETMRGKYFLIHVMSSLKVKDRRHLLKVTQPVQCRTELRIQV